MPTPRNWNQVHLRVLTVLVAVACGAGAQETKPPTPVKPQAKPAAASAADVPKNEPNRVSPGANPMPGTGGRPSTNLPTAPTYPHPVPNGSMITRTREGNELTTRKDGTPANVHVAGRGMEIHHNLNGNRRIVVERPDGLRIVAERGGRGYVQRPYIFRGREYDHRTYYVHGRVYDRFYARYPYRGAYLEMYTPATYYRPAFYSWVYAPWVTPAQYVWGWSTYPWYAYYNYYLTPYPVYAGPTYWLTDYLISTLLAEAYEARVDARLPVQAPPFGASPITPDVRDQIALEVQRQIRIENAEAAAGMQDAPPQPGLSGLPGLLYDGSMKVFLAARDLDVVDSAGSECAISEGDTLQLPGPPPASAGAADLVVLSSKGGQECRKGTVVAVALTDLQEMENHMREIIDQGLAELQSRQGTGGLPAIPAPAKAAPIKTPFASDPSAPGPDHDAAALVSQQSQEADQAERQVLAEAPAESGSGIPFPAATPVVPRDAGPIVISIGQRIEQVKASLGEPINVVDNGMERVYVYPNKVKITVASGRVIDIE